jgi:predicted enzyme related to lactoylglutathione lyase
MAQHVVHFEIIGSDPATLRGYYADLFDWEYDVGDPTTDRVSEPGQYGSVGNAGLNGGVAGGAGFERRVLFYVGVPDVEAALARAEELGGKRVLGPEPSGADFVVGHFTDPEGNLIGVAGGTR